MPIAREKNEGPIVLDSQAVLSFLWNEPAGRRVAEILIRGEPWMTLVNLAEVIYLIERQGGVEVADEIYANLLADEPPDRRAIRWVPVDTRLVRRAASLKALGGMSLADCFAAAAAALLNCPVLTGDREFEVAEAAGITVEWL